MKRVHQQTHVLRVESVSTPDSNEVILVKHLGGFVSPNGSPSNLRHVGMSLDHQNISLFETMDLVVLTFANCFDFGEVKCTPQHIRNAQIGNLSRGLTPFRIDGQAILDVGVVLQHRSRY